MNRPTDNDRARMSLRHLGREQDNVPRARRSQVRATPAARRYAREKGVTLDEVYDLTSSKRITERDVDMAIEKKRIIDRRVKRESHESVSEDTRPIEPVLGTAQPEKQEIAEPAAEDAADEPAAVSTGEKSEITDTEKESAQEKVSEAITPEDKAEADEPAETVEKKEETSESLKAGADLTEPPAEPAAPVDAAHEKHTPAVSPLAQELADEAGIDISEITYGSGPNGRIMRFDVRQLINSKKNQAEEPKQKESVVEMPEKAAADPVEEDDDSADTLDEAESSEKTEPEKIESKVEATETEKSEVPVNQTPAAPESLPSSQTDAPLASKETENDESVPESQEEQPEKQKKPADSIDTIEMRPMTMGLTVNASRLARMLREEKGVTASDYFVSAAQKALSAHPSVGLNAGGKVSLITVSGTDGLVETPPFTETMPNDIACQREDYFKGIGCNRFDKKAFEGTDLAVMVLDGIESVSGCAGSGRPVLFCGAIRAAEGEAPGRFKMPVTLSLSRKGKNVAAGVAFLKMFKDILDKGAFEQEEA